MTTITRTTQTTTTTTVSNDLPNPAQATQVAAQLAQAINQLGQALTAATQQAGAAMPKDGMMQAQSQAPVNLSGGAAGAKPMDIYGAAQTLKNHFALAEGVGMDGRGKGAGDGNIGFSELKRLAESSGTPPDLKQAAKFLLDNKTMTASLDRNNGAKGDAHINMADLNNLLANAPKGGAAMPQANSNLMPTMSAGTMSMLGNAGSSFAPQMQAGMSAPMPSAPNGNSLMGIFNQAAGMSTTTTSAANGNMGITGGGMAAKPMDIYGAAQTLKNHFALAEGVGMDGRGKGAGDGNIGFSELKRLAESSGTPPDLKQAAKFLLDNKTMTASLDRNNGAKGDAHINMADLNNLLANAPKTGTSAQGVTGTSTTSKDIIMEQVKATAFKMTIS
ncbi:hypothetical protein [Cystobacter ferrugineus]|uniref:Uncharacterized protein n=1 Tax=Cystobacter ferrugineus TaxID=83449 RepID=A0A1L9B310_9BACT|nr:hypothetical protein [Cystobacter ferrugineus]OJH36647.1 hypothetical protein BON30_33400 [Cystobacter ferrugineus]